MMGYKRISRATFYKLGGFSNPRMVRKSLGKSWAYFMRVDD